MCVFVGVLLARTTRTDCIYLFAKIFHVAPSGTKPHAWQSGAVKALTRDQLQSREEQAVRFVRDVLGDADWAEEIADESLEDYAARRNEPLLSRLPVQTIHDQYLSRYRTLLPDFTCGGAPDRLRSLADDRSTRLVATMNQRVFQLIRVACFRLVFG